MLMFMLLSSSTKIDSKVTLAHLVVRILSTVLYVCVWASYVFRLSGRLLETWCLLEVGVYLRPCIY